MNERDYLMNEFDDYEPIDLCSIYFPVIVFPDCIPWLGYLRGNPFTGLTEKVIGNTRYWIETVCEGSEPLLSKVKRLMFSGSEVN